MQAIVGGLDARDVGPASHVRRFIRPTHGGDLPAVMGFARWPLKPRLVVLASEGVVLLAGHLSILYPFMASCPMTRR